jgi:outer membrane protein assembly factor BamA
MEPGPDLTSIEARTLDEVRVETLGDLWQEPIEVRSVQVGDSLDGSLVRRALRELDRTGRYADLRAEVQTEGGRTVLVLFVRPRRLISQIRFEGGTLSQSDALRALGLSVGDALTDLELIRAQGALLELYEQSGYPQARVVLLPEEVDNPREILLRVSVASGPSEKQT